MSSHALPRPHHPRALAQLLVMMVLAAGLVLAGPAGDASAASTTKVRNATNIALNQKGDPYRYGAAGPGAFDCSGLIYYSYRKAGISVPRTSGQQAAHARRIAKGNMRRGDLMFFHNGGRVYHAAIFLGWKDGRAQLLHSPRSGSRVHVTRTWTTQWFGGTLRG
ncbi:NlpC/P60 family protein [Nocardioides aurantiacus]|uniref:NlpC/P60 family protein n=2 Tax=Nocardioides aurantiacus TaxID=86796 RepID=A0A3N2CZB2_9ACTN|nr:NlpC/P60 family protein [Nocardioides aurantiacus]